MSVYRAIGPLVYHFGVDFLLVLVPLCHLQKVTAPSADVPRNGSEFVHRFSCLAVSVL